MTADKKRGADERDRRARAFYACLFRTSWSATTNRDPPDCCQTHDKVRVDRPLEERIVGVLSKILSDTHTTRH